MLPLRRSLRVSAPLSDFRSITLPGANSPVYRLVFRINIVNASSISVKLFARKWTIVDMNGNYRVIEAENVFNTQPILAPHGVFSFGGMHDFATLPLSVELSIAGVDQLLAPFLSYPYTFTARQLTPYPNQYPFTPPD